MTDLPPGLGNGFDAELGLTYVEMTPDGGRATLAITDKLLQPWGIVHGGVYCAVIESMASVSGHVWLSKNGGGTVVGVNNNTDFLRAIRIDMGSQHDSTRVQNVCQKNFFACQLSSPIRYRRGTLLYNITVSRGS